MAGSRARNTKKTQGSAAGSDSELTARLIEVLGLKGYALERLTKLDRKTPPIVAHATVFRSFDDPYLVHLEELPADEEVGEPEWERFLERLDASGIERGVLVTNRGFNSEVTKQAELRGKVALFTFDEMLVDLFDFGAYLRNVVDWWEADPLHAGEIVIPAQGSRGDEKRMPLDPYVDRWLDEPGRDPLFILGRYGAGKTTFVKRLAARLAHAWLRDPVHNRIPLLLPLKVYANLTEMDELIVSRIAELAPEQAPPSRHAFRLLLESGKFLLILDGLDELIRRLEQNYVLKNFDKICSLILPGTKAIVTAREGYLGTPEDEAQILGLRKPLTAEPGDEAAVRFERLYLEPVDAKGISWYVRQRYPERAEHYQMVLETRTDLMELADRPLLLELMLRSLPLLEGRVYVNPAVVMTAFIDSWAELGRARRPVLSTADDALFFATELAWQMHWGGVYKVHFTELSPRIRQRFRDKILSIEAPDPFAVDMRECPFIAIDRDGNYQFVQNAFLDFLAALAYMRYLLEHGTAPVDSKRTNPDMQRFVRDLATMDERYLKAYLKLLDELRERDDPTQWLFYRDLLPLKEKARIYAAELERIRGLQAASPLAPPDGMALVPGGDFVFGSFEHRDESPVRRPRLASFFVDVHPVTNADYQKFTEATGHPKPLWTDPDAPNAWVDGRPVDGSELMPVTNVGFEDAVAYAAWAGKRLPTEQEWEMAARGHEGRRFPWGDAFEPLACNGAITGSRRIQPVGRYPEGASPFGCQDMSGNVWEWTNSRYDKLHSLKILKGGSHAADEDELRCANRRFWDPDFPKPDIGFRCVMSAQGAADEPARRAGKEE